MAFQTCGRPKPTMRRKEKSLLFNLHFIYLKKWILAHNMPYGPNFIHWPSVFSPKLYPYPLYMWNYNPSKSKRKIKQALPFVSATLDAQNTISKYLKDLNG